MRDLLGVLGIERATVVGHSFGGGVAMQFAYQFPERTERVVLEASGGLGREVTPLLRALTLPGAREVLTALDAYPGRASMRMVEQAMPACPPDRSLPTSARRRRWWKASGDAPRGRPSCTC